MLLKRSPVLYFKIFFVRHLLLKMAWAVVMMAVVITIQLLFLLLCPSEKRFKSNFSTCLCCQGFLNYLDIT